MTVPTLMQNHQRKTYVTQLHKVYNELSQALIQYQTDRNAINLTEAGLTTLNSIENFFTTYFRIVQNCSTTQAPCFAASYKKIAGTTSSFRCLHNCVSLASGAAIGTVNEFKQGNGVILQFVVDINGPKGPNIFGRDAFSLFLYKNGIIDDLLVDTSDPDAAGDWISGGTAPLSEEQREENFTYGCLGAVSGVYHGCFGKILNDNWDMTY